MAAFGTVIILPDKFDVAKWKAGAWDAVIGCDNLPHILLTVDYITGRLKVPGGSIETGQTPVVAMNTEWQEEVGEIPYQNKFVFETKHKVCRTTINGRITHYFLKIVPLPSWLEISAFRKQNHIQPAHLGETAGVAWMPLAHQQDEFPLTCFKSESNSIYINPEATGDPDIQQCIKYSNNYIILYFYCRLLFKANKGTTVHQTAVENTLLNEKMSLTGWKNKARFHPFL